MKVYIVEAKRSAIGSFLGTLKDVKPGDLAGQVIKDLTKNIDNTIVDEVIVGNILSAGHSQGIGRQASIYGGLPESTVAYSVNMLCGSGMKAVMNAISEIKAGEKDVIIAGGVENMSSAPFLVSSKVRAGTALGDSKLIDSMSDALVDAFEGYHMGITAENIAQKFHITRDMQDEYAIFSQEKAAIADDAGKFINEITPIKVKTRKGDILFDKDEYINRNTSIEKLKKLRPAFKKDGTVTAGNASGINDGASFTLIVSEDAIKKYNLTPLVEIVDVSQVGISPSIMGLSPAYAIEKLLEKNNMSIDEIDLIEINEAFASQILGVFELLKEKVNLTDEILQEKINVNGSGIALGHPVGASANRIIVSLVHQMKKENSKYGLASLCIGGGMGTAILVKNIE
ncbi:thiolase family protein [Arcobacter roscoffensis]|uniref:Thiolase family protein n=1 Tax=Arcobacter roscoffensis TaxID=2961520 RepID=A0ABY5E417_9BACT|nr:thiolase family protein [Arcobacter roscoffensis]UTJ06577.1 thiolase family protein [Arcobacter roscoffensis]